MTDDLRNFLAHLIYWPCFFGVSFVLCVLDMKYGWDIGSSDWKSIAFFITCVFGPLPLTCIPWLKRYNREKSKET